MADGLIKTCKKRKTSYIINEIITVSDLKRTIISFHRHLSSLTRIDY